MKLKFFIITFICSFILISCGKEPKKGDYKGVFTGKYVTDYSSITYTTIYFFEVTQSTKKELRLKEKQSQIISVLKKHENDSISGMIGFGNISIIGANPADGLNTVSIHGKYDKKSIKGTFSTTFNDGNKDYLSEGEFVISAD